MQGRRTANFESLKRGAFYALVLSSMAILTWMFADFLWRVDFSILKTILVAVFSLLCYPICLGFWQAVLGMIPPRYASETAQNDKLPDLSERSIAINIPVYNEEFGPVLARLKTLYQMLEGSGSLSLFDFYLLSDSGNPDNLIAEEYGWARLCRQLGSYDRIFYRRRKRNIHQKAGNLLEFCSSWGRRYKYMVILDADSLMDGKVLLQMTRQMEENSRIGILQSVPLLTRSKTRYALLQQFTNRIYGPLFARGMSYWQGGKGNYWGHNAIIRVEPFIRHCALPDLPGKPPLGGKILSHDFVEAALMIRAGFEVRMLITESGSYEEGPQDILESVARDRRWCQGNLQHVWLLFAEKIHGASKCHFLNGIFAYAGGPLWMLFLAISIALAFEWEKSRLTVVAAEGLSPLGKLSITEHGLLLFTTIMGLLFLPKLLGILRACLSPDRRKKAGGLAAILTTGLSELILSTFVAPILMVFHTRFVILTLFGRGINWTPQSRTSKGISWDSAARSLRLHQILGVLTLLLSLQVNPWFLIWLSPIWGGLLLSIPIAVFSSRPARGSLANRFLTRSEGSEVERLLRENLKDESAALNFFNRTGTGFQNAIADPIINAIHLSLIKESEGQEIPAEAAPDKALFSVDPDELPLEKVQEILESAHNMQVMHEMVWRLPETNLHPKWRSVLERYTLKPVFSP